MKRIGRPLEFLSDTERVEATNKTFGEEHRDSKKRRTEEEASLKYSDQKSSNEQAKQDGNAENRSMRSSNSSAVTVASVVHSAASDGQVSNMLDLPASVSFPEKIMQILDDKEDSEAIWWQEHGESFAIDRTNITKVLDSFFQRSKYSSFTRKLNKWGFRRVPFEGETSEIVAYHHEFFRRGKPELLLHMKTGGKKDKRDKKSFLAPNIQGESKLPPDLLLQQAIIGPPSRSPSLSTGISASIADRASPTQQASKSEPALEALIAQRHQQQLLSRTSALQQRQHIQQIQQQAQMQQQQQQQQQQGNSITIEALAQLRARMASQPTSQLTQLNLLAGSIAPSATSQLANLPGAAASSLAFRDDPSNNLLLRRDGNLSQEEILTILLLRQNNLDTFGNLYWG